MIQGRKLVATRSLAALDELRVPYGTVDGAGVDGSWASISAGDPRRALYWFAGHSGETDGWLLGSIPIWGRVVPESVVGAFARSLDGDWRPEVPILDRTGAPHASVWRSSQGGTILPFDPDELVANLRSERYRRLEGSSSGLSLAKAARDGYYRVKPVIPRRLQIALRRAFSPVQTRSGFPRWPVETALHDLTDFVLARVADAAAAPVPYVAAWPRGHDWALVITHDVETAVGRDAIEGLRAVEVAAGYRSSWNLVPERYPVDDALVAHLQSVGCEVGVHGLRHDGRDLGVPERVPAMRRFAARWGAVGFRSPATHRAWELMPQLGFAYDSSYPDTDPYEPMSGGCCSWLPFFNQAMVELPITLPQDHTLFVILRRDESLWREKAELLRARGGMALLVTHPDYMIDSRRLGAYARFLDAFREDPTVWTALPREVAEWWRRRAATSLQPVGGSWQASGPAAAEVAISYAEPGASADPPRQDSQLVALA